MKLVVPVSRTPISHSWLEIQGEGIRRGIDANINVYNFFRAAAIVAFTALGTAFPWRMANLLTAFGLLVGGTLGLRMCGRG